MTARTASVEAAFKNNSATVDDLTGLARELLAASDHAAALVWAERAKAKFPAAQAADEAVADALFAAGQWSRALPHYQAAQLHRPLAQCHLKLGHYDEAEKALLEVLRRDTNDVGTLCSLGALKKKQNAYGDARRYLEDALKLVPFGGKPWLEASMSLADCLRKTENYEESKRLYVKVLKRAEVEYGKRSAQVAAALNALGMLTKKLGQVGGGAELVVARSHVPHSTRRRKSTTRVREHSACARANQPLTCSSAAIKLKVALCGGSFNHAEVAEYMANLGDVMRKESNFAQVTVDPNHGRKIVSLSLHCRQRRFTCAQWPSLKPPWVPSTSILRTCSTRSDWSRKSGVTTIKPPFCTIVRCPFAKRPSRLNRTTRRASTSITAPTVRTCARGICALTAPVTVERKRGHYDRALDMYKQSLDMLRVTVGPMHSECADPLHATGLVLHQLGKYQDAVESITQALKIVEREFGKNHYKASAPAVARSPLLTVFICLFFSVRRVPELERPCQGHAQRH